MNDQHYYGYGVDSLPVAGGYLFRVYAQGDLDCDGVTSTMGMGGRGTHQNSWGDCQVQSASGIYYRLATE